MYSHPSSSLSVVVNEERSSTGGTADFPAIWQGARFQLGFGIVWKSLLRGGRRQHCCCCCCRHLWEGLSNGNATPRRFRSITHKTGRAHSHEPRDCIQWYLQLGSYPRRGSGVVVDKVASAFVVTLLLPAWWQPSWGRNHLLNGLEKWNTSNTHLLMLSFSWWNEVFSRGKYLPQDW